MIDTIIFDSEGVIVDTEAIWDKGQEEFLRRRGITYDREQTKHLLTGRSLADGAEVLKEKYGFPGDRDELARERLAIVADEMARDVKFMDGFLEFFAQIRHEYKTCIATAMPMELLSVIDRKLGLSELFQKHIYSVADVGFRSKPWPDLFLHAARQVESQPQQCVVIEDAPLGIEAARRAGMKSIGLATTYQKSRLLAADQVVDSFPQIDLAAL
jgi:beta-phosphoglucomutase